VIFNLAIGHVRGGNVVEELFIKALTEHPACAGYERNRTCPQRCG
jgi:hypothetical protein